MIVLPAADLAVLLGVTAEHLRSCISKDKNGPKPVRKTKSATSQCRRKPRYHYDRDTVMTWWANRGVKT